MYSCKTITADRTRAYYAACNYQNPDPQGKLVRVVQGAVFDGTVVTVDLSRGSPNFGKWASAVVSAENKTQVWVPEGFAHGFTVISETADVLYKTADYWYPEHEFTLLWNDPALGVVWPLMGPPQVSAKDAQGKRLAEANLFD